MLRLYDFYLKTNPLTTKMLTNLGICVTGDLLCQNITQWYSSESKETDWVRTARFGVVGACV